jgi:hypothetical protein
MSVACARCEIPAPAARASAQPSPEPVCWSHQLEAMLATTDAPLVVVVARHETALFERVSDSLLDEPRVSVVLDRRRGDWGNPRTPWTATPATERRRTHAILKASRTHPVEVRSRA